MTTLFSLKFAAIFSAFLFFNFTNAFQLTFPVGPNSALIGVALFNVDTKKLNGNYQIANSLQSIAGTAKVRPNCVEAGDGYFVGFVNSSQYALNHPEIYYSSPTFSIQPNTSEIQTPTSSSQSNGSSTDSGSNGTSQSNSFGPANAGQAANTDQAKPINGAKDGAIQVKLFTAIALIGPLIACISLYLSL